MFKKYNTKNDKGTYHLVTENQNIQEPYNSTSSLEISETETNELDFSHLSPVYIDNLDSYFNEAGWLIIERERASIGLIQRTLKIGFNRADRIMNQLEQAGLVDVPDGTSQRKILMSIEQFDFMIENNLILNNDVSNNNSSDNDTFWLPCEDERIALYNDRFDYMTGRDFEVYCAGLLEKSGFSDVQITQASGDFGIDILATQNMILHAIQCKCYSSDIGVDAVYQALSGSKYYKANIGIVLTNQYFTYQARELAKEIGVVLWDRDFLVKLIAITKKDD